MPTVERISLPQSLSAVASKGRRLFSRETALTSTDAQSRFSTPLRASALSLNEALEQAWVSTASPSCFNNQLLPQLPSIPRQSQGFSWDRDLGRRRSSNTTTTSTSSSAGFAPEAPQRRRKSLFSKKPRSEQLVDGAVREDSHSPATHFVDPFAHEAQHDARGSTTLKPPSQLGSDQDGRAVVNDRSSQRLSIKQQQKREALDRISDLICLSVEHQTQLPRSQIGASSPRLLPVSPSMSDSTFFYPIEAPPSPTSLMSSSNSSERRASIIAFPSRMDASRGLRLNISGDTHSSPTSSSVASPSMSTFSTQADFSLQECDRSMEHSHDASSSFEHYQLLLPSSMKRQPSRTIDHDASKRSSMSLRAEVGHGSERGLQPSRRHDLITHSSSEWLRMEEMQRRSQPPPPLRPSRNPMRSRSKSLSSPSVPSRSPSPPPPMPSLPVASPRVPVATANASGLAGPYDLAPVHTPPSSRPASAHRRQSRARCDSLTSATSSASLLAASFHTPTFGSASWTTLPVS
ncbi:hypothetical protein EX895_002560 [Sporisorium graminicola]|uniref:Uncharacterized protein n=1 Tax=Sporisorium graminicola TaxID=280036 RepID=A0A4U7KVD1_9BASI|nr:hypothetical protein EX895_002560 [Sporisorium graminicola]TKY88571.1 hypothetical protein EX895_002560 [Sporisorium graminicola]